MEVYAFGLRFDWSLGLIYKYPSTGSDSGLVPTRRQFIICTKDGLFTDAYMRYLASMS